ncbi:MAG: 5-(carboxyamino)imidazole ribonucleotide synthase [Sphingopyxis sp.]
MAPLPLAPGSTIGIVGGGQLGRMLSLAAAKLGYRSHIFAPEADAVAAAVAHAHTHAAYDDAMALNAFASGVDVVTFEFENVPLETIRHLAEHRPVFPGAHALAVAQDRVAEKQFAHGCAVPIARYAEVRSAADLAAAVEKLGLPAILKTVREGYDGKGQALIEDASAAQAAWESIGGTRAVLEERVDFAAEFSVILVRGADGATALWDCPENVHGDGMLLRSAVPVRGDIAKQLPQAIAYARAMADALGYVGVLACEFFAASDGPLLNEFAPRVHNSGHWTIEGAVTSQFENHIRAICGLPLGSTALVGTGATMHNIIGDEAANWADYLSDPDCHLHLYGKGHGRTARKMGHATWVTLGAARGGGAQVARA